MRIALVHDYLNQYGGAERVLEVLQKSYPQAPIYTLFYDAHGTGHAFDDAVVRTSFLQRLPFVRSHHRLFPSVMPMAVESFDLSFFDVVLSDSASFAKGVLTRYDAPHICYCHTPTRFLWGDSAQYLEEFPIPGALKRVAPLLLHQMRVWDREAAHRVDHFIANSHFVARRIRHVYKRDASVIYPPVEVRRFHPVATSDKGDFFLVVGRFLSYKRFDIAVQAACEADVPLVVVGDGPERRRLESMAGPRTLFVGQISDKRLAMLYARARALLFPQEEDFGITAVEAMAAGTPVIAYRGGGALETVREGVTGLFLDHQMAEDLVPLLRSFSDEEFHADRIREHALQFRVERFQHEMTSFIHDVVQGV